MSLRRSRRSARGIGRILLGVVMVIFAPVWLVFAVVDYSRPTVPTNNLVAPSVEVHDETGSFEPIDGRPLTDALGDVKFTRPIHLVILSTDDLVDDNLDEATLKYARARHQAGRFHSQVRAGSKVRAGAAPGVDLTQWVQVGRRLPDPVVVAHPPQGGDILRRGHCPVAVRSRGDPGRREG